MPESYMRVECVTDEEPHDNLTSMYVSVDFDPGISLGIAAYTVNYGCGLENATPPENRIRQFADIIVLPMDSIGQATI